MNRSKCLPLILFLALLPGRSALWAQEEIEDIFKDDLLKHHYFYRSENDSFPVFSDSLIEKMKNAGTFRLHFRRIYTERGNYYEHIGQPGRAYDEFDHMYDLSLRYKDTATFGLANGSIAWLNGKYGREDLAIKRLHINLKLWQSIDDFMHCGNACYHIQSAYLSLEDYANSLDYAKRSYHYYRLTEDTAQIMQARYWLARAYSDAVYHGITQDSSYIDSAVIMNNKSMSYHLEKKNNYWLLRNYLVAGRIELMKNDFGSARRDCQNSMLLYSKSTVNDTYLDACDCLAKANEGLKNYKEALSWRESFRHLKDSINNLGYAVELEQKELTEDLEKEKLADQLMTEVEQNKKRVELENDLKAKQTYVIIGVIIFIIFLVVFLWIRRNARQKEVVNQQISHYNREITDSINYAKRIQTAILPSDRLISNHLEDYFIYYQPKDIVAGDFYWFESVGDIQLFAAADCTGHGVPGAMVSVVCHNALNRAVREYRNIDPGAILDKTKELVVEAFQNRGIENRAIRDGMDIALCSFNTKTHELKFAGAHNPVWIMRKDQNEMEIIKGTRQPVGETDTTIPFETHSFQLGKGDRVYFFTDGFADQFGGPEGKKFRYKTLKQLLIDNAKLSFEEQKTLLEESLEKWMGDIEQIDDICVIGVRV